MIMIKLKCIKVFLKKLHAFCKKIEQSFKLILKFYLKMHFSFDIIVLDTSNFITIKNEQFS